MPGALDELHHADAMAASQHAQREPEGRRRFALARPGMDHQQALLDGLASDLGILDGLAFLHLGAMTGGSGIVDRRVHVLPFTTSGRPATIITTRSARDATRWLSRPWASRKRRASALSGTMPRPTSFDTSTTGTWA